MASIEHYLCLLYEHGVNNTNVRINILYLPEIRGTFSLVVFSWIVIISFRMFTSLLW